MANRIFTLSSTSGSCPTIEFEFYPNGKEANIQISDPDSLCSDNNYMGDFANIDLTIDQMKQIRDYLNEILEGN